MLNRIVLQGRLTKDPELRQTQNGVAVCQITLACERNYSGNSERLTDFIDTVFWRQTAEFVARYFRKGDMMVAEGTLQSRHWQDRNGNERTAWEVQADRAYFCGTRRDGGSEFHEVDDDGDLPF